MMLYVWLCWSYCFETEKSKECEISFSQWEGVVEETLTINHDAENMNLNFLLIVKLRVFGLEFRKKISNDSKEMR